MRDSASTIELGLEQSDPRALRQAALDGLGEDGLLALAGSAPVGLFASVQPYGNVLVNVRLCEITGRPTAELLGHRWLEAVHPDDRAAVERATRDAAEGTGELDLEYRVLRPDGEVRWVEVQAVGIRGASVAATFVGSMVDVTEFKQVEAALRDSELRFRSLVEHSLDAIVVLERDGRVRYASPSTSQMTGYPQGSMVGQDIYDLLHPEDVEVLAEAIASSTPDPRAGASSPSGPATPTGAG